MEKRNGGAVKRAGEAEVKEGVKQSMKAKKTGDKEREEEEKKRKQGRLR